MIDRFNSNPFEEVCIICDKSFEPDGDEILCYECEKAYDNMESE